MTVWHYRPVKPPPPVPCHGMEAAFQHPLSLPFSSLPSARRWDNLAAQAFSWGMQQPPQVSIQPLTEQQEGKTRLKSYTVPLGTCINSVPSLRRSLEDVAVKLQAEEHDQREARLRDYSKTPSRTVWGSVGSHGRVQFPRAVEPRERGRRDLSSEACTHQTSCKRRAGAGAASQRSPQCRARPRCWPGQDEGRSLLCAVKRCLVSVTLVQLVIPLLGQNNPGAGHFFGSI